MPTALPTPDVSSGWGAQLNGYLTEQAEVPRAYVGDKRIFVSASGNDANDGRAQGSAVKTIAAAIALLTSGGHIQLGGGAFQLPVTAGSVLITGRNDITISGLGPNLTQIVVNGNYSAFVLTGVCARINLKDLWIGTFAARTAGYAVSVVGTAGVHSDNVNLDNVVIQNMPQGVSMQYVDSAKWNRVKYVQSIAGAAIPGALFRVVQSASHDFNRPIVQSTAGQIASDAMVFDGDTDTMIVHDAELLNAQRGVVLLNTLGGSATGPRLVKMFAPFIEAMTSSGLVINACRSFEGFSVHTAVNGGIGIDITGGTAIAFTGGLSLQNGQHGAYVHGAAVNDASFLNWKSSNNGTSGPSYDGLRVEDNTGHVRVIGSRLGDFYFGGASQRYGMSVGSTATDYITAMGNDFSGNVTGPLGNFSTGTHNTFLGNQ